MPKPEFPGWKFQSETNFPQKRDERTYVMNEIGGNSPFIRFHGYV